MKKTNTKELILNAALDLFSEKGFDATSTEDLARMVGIKKPSLYEHFKNKQDILDTLLLKLTNEYDDNSIFSYKIVDKDLSVNGLIELIQKQVFFLLHNDRVVKIRRFLTIEQYRNSQICDIQNKQVYDNVFSFNKDLILKLINNNILIKKDIDVMTCEFAFPISAWISLCDRYPGKEGYVMEMIEKHVKQFISIYSK